MCECVCMHVHVCEFVCVCQAGAGWCSGCSIDLLAQSCVGITVVTLSKSLYRHCSSILIKLLVETYMYV